MDAPARPAPSHTSLFQVYLRLRPPQTTPSYVLNTLSESSPERFIIVEPPASPSEELASFKSASTAPIHITLQPPTDSRKRAVEKFAFTKVFEEDASQLDLFTEAGVGGLVKGVLELKGGCDGLVATLGVTGSGKVGTMACYF